MTDKVKKNWLEWIVFTVSSVIVVGMLGYLIWDGLTKDETPPYIVVELGATRQEPDRYVIPVTLHNDGGQPAKAVAIEVTLMTAGMEVETAELQVDYVPRSSKREGWVTFTENPAEADEIQVHVLGYEQP